MSLVKISSGMHEPIAQSHVAPHRLPILCTYTTVPSYELELIQAHVHVLLPHYNYASCKNS